MLNRLFIFLNSLALLGLFASPALADDETSWLGKQVMPKKAGIKIRRTENGQEIIVATLTGLTYRVLKQDGDWIRVEQAGVEGWIDKDEAVLVVEAPAYFKERIENNPNDDYAYGSRGWACPHRSNDQKALGDLNQAIRLNPKARAWFYYRGRIYREQWGDYERAIADFTEAVRLDPKYADAHRERDSTYRAMLNKIIPEAPPPPTVPATIDP